MIDVLRGDGSGPEAPNQNELGESEYRPSRAALRKWGYSEEDVVELGRSEPAVP